MDLERDTLYTFKHVLNVKSVTMWIAHAMHSRT